MASMFKEETKMISDKNIIKMADQLHQCINDLSELTAIIGILVKRIEELENKTEIILHTLN